MRLVIYRTEHGAVVVWLGVAEMFLILGLLIAQRTVCL